MTGADAGQRRRAAGAPAEHGRRWRLQRRLRAARPQVDGRYPGPAGSRAVARPPAHPRSSRPIPQRGVQVPVEVSVPPDANWTRRPAGLHARQHGRGRPPLRAGGRCLARPGLVLDPGRPARSGRRAPTCWRAIRRSTRPISSARRCMAAPSMAWSPRRRWACRSRPTGSVPALDRKRADVLRNDRAGPARAGAVAARRHDGGRARAVRRVDRRRSALYRGGDGAGPEGRTCPPSRCASATPTGTSATTSRAMTAAMYPIPPWQPAERLRASTARWSTASCARSRRSIPRRARSSAPWA